MSHIKLGNFIKVNSIELMVLLIYEAYFAVYPVNTVVNQTSVQKCLFVPWRITH